MIQTSIRHFAVHSQTGIETPDGKDQERLTLTCAGHALTQVTGAKGSVNLYRELFAGLIQPNPQNAGDIIVDDALEKSIALSAKQ